MQQINYPSLSFDEAFSFILRYVTSSSSPRPVMLWGPPGVGKTALVKKLARTLAEPTELETQDSYLRMFYAAYMEPTDVAGFPVPDYATQSTKLFPLESVPTYPRSVDNPGVLFFDELSNARRDVQTVLLEIMREGSVAGRPLPEGWVRIAAGNRLEDAAGSNAMITSLQDRLLHLELKPDLDEVCRHFLTDYPLDVAALVVGFLRFRPELFHVEPVLSPRSWADVIAMLHAVGVSEESLRMAGGIVGTSTAGELLAFYKLRQELPSVKEILDAPETTVVPDVQSSPGLGYAMATMLIEAVSRAPSTDKFDAALAYMERLPILYTALFVNGLAKSLPDESAGVMGTERFTRWLVDNQAILF